MSGSAWGAESAAFKAEVGISALRFNYHEFDESGRVLDKEVGGIPGFSLKAGQRFSAWEWETTGSFHYGKVRYVGQTAKTHIPYDTNTNETIGDLSLRLGRWFDGRYPVMPYVGLGYHRWDRDIVSGSLGDGSPVSGVFESYRWKYLWLGSKFTLHQKAASLMLLDVGVIKPFGVELLTNYQGNPTLHPQGLAGLRIALTSYFPVSNNSRIAIEPYYEYWKLGRSSIVTVAGVTDLYVEPSSTTKNVGLNLRLGWMF